MSQEKPILQNTIIIINYNNTIIMLFFFQVVSSIVDQDKFAGFVGAQKRKEREGKSPSPVPPTLSQRSISPSQTTEG